MGREIRCLAEVGDWTGEGRLLLETDELIFRGARRLAVPRSAVREVRHEDGWLVVRHDGGSDRFLLGDLAPSWANAITHPRTRIDKLDVKPDARVLLSGAFEDDFLEEVSARAAQVATADGAAQSFDLVFLRLESADELRDLARLRDRVGDRGAIWVVFPKGNVELRHETIVEAARAAGLVDVKSARYSTSHTALKLMVPKALRSRP